MFAITPEGTIVTSRPVLSLLNVPFVPTPEILSAYRRHDGHKSGAGGARRREEVLTIARQHASERMRRAYEFAATHWTAVQGWSSRRRSFERMGFPGAGMLARATTPELWTLPRGLTVSDLRVARGMLDDA